MTQLDLPYVKVKFRLTNENSACKILQVGSEKEKFERYVSSPVKLCHMLREQKVFKIGLIRKSFDYEHNGSRLFQKRV